MLATLIPGVREVRAPLIAGYLWLLSFWLLLEPDFHDEKNHNELFDSLSRLGEELTPLGIGIVVSVVAYLLGALVVEAVDSLFFLVRRNRTPSESARLPGTELSARSDLVLAQLVDERAQSVEEQFKESSADINSLYQELLGVDDRYSAAALQPAQGAGSAAPASPSRERESLTAQAANEHACLPPERTADLPSLATVDGVILVRMWLASLHH